MSSPSSRTRTQASGWSSRLAAGELVQASLAGGGDLEAAMAASRTFSALDGPDRGFARAMASMALRGAGRIDWALGALLDRSLSALEAPVLALLRVGAAQLWLMDVAGHAAVSATVEAAAHWDGARRGGGLINAVLRRAAREKEAFEAAPAEAVWPDWLAARLRSALGPERARAMALLQLEEPSVDISLREPAAGAEWADRLGASLLPNGSVRLPGAAGLSALPGYASGEWWVQDVAASLPVGLMGDVRGQRVADLCAAPGGKAMQLASLGAQLTALDVSDKRLARLRENFARTGLCAQILKSDARSFRPEALFDAVLLDAPCSALGTIRRHPEGVWRRNPKDLARYPEIQRDLIAAAGRLLKSGGRLVYAVCTPTPEEGPGVIAAAIAGGGWRRLPVSPSEVPGFAGSVTPEGDVLTAPPPTLTDAPQTRCDVFHISRLERI